MSHHLVELERIVCRRASHAEILALRHAELRPGLSLSTAIFDGDDEPETRHFGAFLDGKNVACASFMLRPYENEPAWQLRGMATRSDLQRRSIGSVLLHAAEENLLIESPIRLFWCNARILAVPFYQKHGWEIVSDLFDIPTVGPHYRMVRRLA